MSLFERTHTKRHDPIQSVKAAAKVESNLTAMQAYALSQIKLRPGLTRSEWQKHDPKEKVCKRAYELERDGLILRIKDIRTGEYRIFPKD